MKKYLYIGILLLITVAAHSQTVISPGDYHGADLTMGPGQQLTGGHYYNIGTFTIPAGTTITIARNTGVVRITANQIVIRGILNGSSAGYIGGLQASCPGANPGITGSGPGGGTGGAYGPSVHGNGGAGGGHGGNGGDSGNAIASPTPSLGGLAYGDVTTQTIDMGSGGGSGSNYLNCSAVGGRGGAGGAGIHLESPNFLSTGQIIARGENGFSGTSGAGMYASGGAGSGGGVLITGAGTIGGLIDVNGGNGGNSPNSGLSIGGGGGAGGHIKLFGSFTNTAVMRVNGGIAGTSFSAAVSQSKPGQLGVITIQSTAPTIATLALGAAEFCAGAENVSVNFTTSGSFGASNVFTAQISNSAGSFTSPVNIGTSTSAGTILAALPANLEAGSGYRVRVVSSDPVVAGTNNGSNITINGSPSATLSGSTSICPGASTTISIALTGESPWSGTYTDGVNAIPFNAATTPLLLTVSPSATTTFSLVSVNDANCNGTVSGNAVVTVGDSEAPVPNVAELPALTAECGLTATPPTATDNCAGQVIATTEDPTTFDTQGSFMIHWTFTDGQGNSSTQQQSVIIDDVTAPVVSASPADVIAQCGVTITDLPTASDNCSGLITGVTTDPLTYSAEGAYSITWTFDDGNGNISSAVQNVVVDDTEAPVPDATLPVLTSQCALTVTTTPTATDNCVGAIVATTADALTYEEEGTYVIRWIFDDGNGNILEANQTVIIDDTEAPVLDVALADLTAQCSLTVSVIPTATDNCAGAITATTIDPLNYDTEGAYVIHWRFDDGNGNVLEVEQNVLIDDTEAPVLDAPLAELSAQCALTITTSPTATDNCGSVVTGTTEDPLTFTTQGTFVVNWKFNDGHGNTLESAQTVIIDDTQAPVPTVATLPLINGGCSATVTDIPTATDNCAGTILATTTNPLSYSVPGTFVITWTFDDHNGNTTQQTQTVVIEDNASPVIPTPVFEVSSATNAGVCGRIVEFEDPIATDNCAVVRFERTDNTGLESGDVFPAGTTVISYEAEDAAGNITEASFPVTITNDAPVITSVSGPTEAKAVNTYVTITASFVDDNAQSASINWGDGSVTTGAIAGTTITAQHRYTDAGVYAISVELTDACGEVAEATYSVVIYDQDAGHVTGAGLFISPRDAYTADRHVSCVGAFEINIKYKTGRTTPEGKTELKLLGSNLRFKSTSYDWLTIADDFAVFQGKGEFNGQRGYSFLVSVVDVHKHWNGNDRWNIEFDKFRIKIWNAAGVVVYDNQRGASNFEEPTTPILGAIVIHDGKKRKSTPGMREENEVVSPEAFSMETALSVYPNPFIDVITVQLDPQVKVNPRIQMFDNAGKPLYDREHVYQESGTYSVNLGEAAAKSGMYLLRISQDQRTQVIKVFGGAR